MISIELPDDDLMAWLRRCAEDEGCSRPDPDYIAATIHEMLSFLREEQGEGCVGRAGNA